MNKQLELDIDTSKQLELDLCLKINNQLEVGIKREIESRNIQWVCHFTPRENIENIKKFGLLPRNQIEHSTYVDALVTDNERWDGNLDTICLSVSKPNSWMFKMKEKEGFDLCLLLIDPKVLYEKKCIFYPHNAATKSYKHIQKTDLMGVRAFNNLFSETITYQKSGQEPTVMHRSPLLMSAETTSDQAEIQCYDRIEPECIRYIIEEKIPHTYQEICSFVSMKQSEDKQYIEQDISSIQAPSAVSDSTHSSNDLTDKEIKKLLKEAIKDVQVHREKLKEQIKENKEEIHDYVYNNDTTKQNLHLKDIDFSRKNDKKQSNTDSGCGCLIIITILLFYFW
ncbi:MAG: DUF4433 domain-containing protein [Pasteurella sp.]|nr:DUF4433 domain-containing protein [Pasteurella sp.]